VPWRFFHRRPAPVQAPPEAPSRVGLALGGGAVRGAAHLGVLAVLEEAGIRPAVVAGTSAGALVGAGVAAGLCSAEMLKSFEAANWRGVARPAWRSKLSMLDPYPLGDLMERVTGASDFADLELPFAAVACDVITGTRVVLTEGPLREALLASSAIPALFEPVQRGEQLLVDGGLVDNLPVDAALALGADYVIAVDIMPRLNGSFVPHDVRDMLLLSWNIVQRAAELGRERADVVITPQVAAVSLSDFSAVDAAYAAGVEAARAALPTLEEALALPGRAG